ncbi:hypothetical protein NW762_014245 [Fusarium torreyae]|uniref:Uncharacterized protein n=1 Tax=Fusarium torreyae TaxID=1237075 RepID=A0A9W8RM12_9HYPO|nr:hypothetical protein NW762_014245 [Fusarium torreyae]
MTSSREGAGWFRRMFSNDYQELPQHGGDIKDKPEPSSQMMPRRFLRLSTRGFLLVLAAILLVPTLLALAAIEGRQYLSDGTADVFDMSGTSGTQEPATKASPIPAAKPAVQAPQEPAGIPVSVNPTAILEEQSIFNRRLVILLPANSAGVNLCKAMVTAIALGYPAPIVINWGKSGSHLAKIAGVLDYLDWSSRLPLTNKDRLGEDDLIMVADSADSWFQLPPAVLLQRYHALNREADERLRQQWTGSGEMPMKQTIMVSAQKRCWPQPKSGSELHCEALPESPLREDLYGPETDKDPDMRQVDVRPKFINSGAFIGPVGDMRRYFRRAQGRYEAGKGIQGNHFYSDQGFFGEIWGEQEMWRTWRRELGDKIDAAQNASIMVHDQFEYHVGLDYYQTISIPTVFEEDDGDILTLNNHTLIAERSKELEISPPRLRVPDDLVNATNPLSRILGAEAGSLDWGDMTLYADFFTTAVPVNVHHNAHINNLKGRRVWWWDRMWFFPYLRQLVEAQLGQRRQAPLGRVNIPEGRAVYWGLEAYKKIRKFMPTRGILEEANFDNICQSRWAKKNKQEWWDVVFRDDKGPLEV